MRDVGIGILLEMLDRQRNRCRLAHGEQGVHGALANQGIAVSQRLELRMPVPFPAISLGRFGRSAGTATLAPFATLVALNGGTLYPSVGAGFQMFFDVVRVDVARGLRDGRWMWSVDAAPAFWSIL